MQVDDEIFTPTNRSSVIKPYVMSHGTLDCRDLKASRRFYEEFLGLECVRHSKPAIAIRCGVKFHIFCVEVGENIHPVNLLNHWGIDVAAKEDVDDAFENAKKLKDKYGIRQITPPSLQHGVYSFYLEDLDHNWWEVQYFEDFQHDDLFEFGDIFSMDEGADLTA